MPPPLDVPFVFTFTGLLVYPAAIVSKCLVLYICLRYPHLGFNDSAGRRGAQVTVCKVVVAMVILMLFKFSWRPALVASVSLAQVTLLFVFVYLLACLLIPMRTHGHGARTSPPPRLEAPAKWQGP